MQETNVDVLIKNQIESVYYAFKEHHEFALENIKAMQSRLVWFVGISGYALLNSKSIWESVNGGQVSGLSIVWLSTPWLLCALLGAVTHFLLGQLVKQLNRQRHLRLLSLSLQKGTAIGINTEGDLKTELNKIMEVISSESPELKKAEKSVGAWNWWCLLFDRLTFLALVFGFIWSVIGPLILQTQ